MLCALLLHLCFFHNLCETTSESEIIYSQLKCTEHTGEKQDSKVRTWLCNYSGHVLLDDE